MHTQCVVSQPVFYVCTYRRSWYRMCSRHCAFFMKHTLSRTWECRVYFICFMLNNSSFQHVLLPLNVLCFADADVEYTLFMEQQYRLRFDMSARFTLVGMFISCSVPNCIRWNLATSPICLVDCRSPERNQVKTIMRRTSVMLVHMIYSLDSLVLLTGNLLLLVRFTSTGY